MMRSGQLPPLESGLCVAKYIMVAASFVLQCSLDGAHNHALPRPQVARESRLERQPNAARRKCIGALSGDGGANELRDRVRDGIV